jgi:hypothetical protein
VLQLDYHTVHVESKRKMRVYGRELKENEGDRRVRSIESRWVQADEKSKARTLCEKRNGLSFSHRMRVAARKFKSCATRERLLLGRSQSQ